MNEHTPDSSQDHTSPEDTTDSHNAKSFSTPGSSGNAHDPSSRSNTSNTQSQIQSQPATHGPHLNPRSCVICRRRKVRCDKTDPCKNCRKAGIECTFPLPGRAPRKARKPPDTELLARLRRLEGVVQTLGVGVDEDGNVSSTSPRAGKAGNSSVEEELGASDKRASIGGVDKELGRLVINDGRSRYVSNAFWASTGDELSEMRNILDDDTTDSDDDGNGTMTPNGYKSISDPNSPNNKILHYPDPYSTAPQHHSAFLFKYSSNAHSLRQLHPTPSQTFMLWEIYKENVDPLVRILHRPTARILLINASSTAVSTPLPRPVECLLFAIYFSSVVSLTPSQCKSLLGTEKDVLLSRYRFALEQALARADFLNTSSLMVLQSFVFYLIAVRHVDDTRLVWSLSGLATHLAQAQGVHRDGAHFGIPPFETEMRRRLWWHISILDTRASEDHGTESIFTESFYDTKFPLNINDEDLRPDMTEFPEEHEGTTEISFCLIRFELSALSRKIGAAVPGIGPNGQLIRGRTLEEKEKLIEEAHKMIEEKYLKHCDMTVP